MNKHGKRPVWGRASGWLAAILIFASGLCGIGHAVAEVEIGYTRLEVIELLGQPQGVLRDKNTESFVYPRTTIHLRDGKVVRVQGSAALVQRGDLVKPEPEPAPEPEPPAAPAAPTIDIAAATAAAEAPPVAAAPTGFVARVKALIERILRLVFFWKKPATAVAGSSDAGVNVRVISTGGSEVALGDLLVPGKVTVVDFYADWCPPCRVVSPLLEKLALDDPEVHLRKVDIVKWGTPVTSQYAITSVPNIRVFDRHGKAVGSPTSNPREVERLIAQARKS